MYAYCLNNPTIYKDHVGFAAVLLFDKDFVGHIGLLVQDENDTWWHFYWGTDPGLDRWLCPFMIPLEATTWCVEYTGEISLQEINDSKQYSEDYEELVYISGDFSSCVSEMKKPTGKYHLYNRNCSQVSFEILSSAKPPQHNIFYNSSKRMLPYIAFTQYKLETLIENGNIVTYIGRILEKFFS